MAQAIIELSCCLLGAHCGTIENLNNRRCECLSGLIFGILCSFVECSDSFFGENCSSLIALCVAYELEGVSDGT